jgi:type IV fimbrial biogenesis protein FimT
MSRQRGVTLIELMIGIAIVAMLLVMGAPSFSMWIQNSQNRAAAESILNGLQLARNEAVRRNTAVRFDLADATGLVVWNVGCGTVTASCPATIQSHPAAEGSANARVGISVTPIPVPTPTNQFSTAIAAGTELPGGVSFDGLGRVVDVNNDIARVDITNAVSSSARRYVVMIGAGGLIRMCDPALVFASNSQGCS